MSKTLHKVRRSAAEKQVEDALVRLSRAVSGLRSAVSMLSSPPEAARVWESRNSPELLKTPKTRRRVGVR